MRRPALLVLASAAVALSACGPKEEKKTAEAPAAAPAPAASTPAAPSVPPTEEQAKVLATLPAPYNTADIAAGKRQFAKCRSCHTLTEGGPNMTGPNLWGVFGRKAGSLPGYTYSEAVKNAGFTWDAQHLDAWLADPRGYMPGTKMSFAGVKAEQDRINLIAYLKVETGYKAG